MRDHPRSQLKKKVLLVGDDENLIRHSLPWVLQDDSTDVLCAMNGYEAFRELRSQTIDLCFLDIHLPDLNALDLMWTIKRLSPATRIIVMTGNDVNSDTMNAIWDYAVLRLVKPFDLYLAKSLADEIMEKQLDGYRDYDDLVNHLVGEKRLHDRKLVVPPVNYTVLVNDGDDDHRRHIADAVDISVNGLGIRTNVLLEKGRIVRLKSKNESIHGIVRWVTPDNNGERCRAGIQIL